MLLLEPKYWKDYELIDSGDYEKLERFGKYIISRPEPQAVWQKLYPKTNGSGWLMQLSNVKKENHRMTAMKEGSGYKKRGCPTNGL